MSAKEQGKYKDTVRLPTTAFPQRGDLAKREPELVARWKAEDIYRRIQDAREGEQSFVLHDGPPYSNGHIHYGHILNKVLKDIVVKHKTMMGFHAPYIPGWDTHGLPIELAVERELGGKRAGMSQADVRAACKAYAMKFVEIQRHEFERLGVFGDWSHPYLTLSPVYEKAIVKALAAFAKGGWLYRGKKPVYWCARDKTALAEAEIEYADKHSPSIYVRFPLDDTDAGELDPSLAGGTVALPIWTTTPWTLPANLAIVLHPEFAYVALPSPVAGEWLVCAAALAETFTRAIGRPELLERAVAITPARLKTLEGKRYTHPFVAASAAAGAEASFRVWFADYVTTEQGTGLVHTAPGHGVDDYRTGQKHGLPPFAPLDDAARYTDEAPAFLIGKSTEEANPLVVEHLVASGHLLNQAGEKVKHSYPHCWRCKGPIVFRATSQWFVAIDHNQLRERALTAIREQVEWVPPWGENRIYAMIEGRPDWVLSRQRLWGTPIPAFYCGACNTPHADGKTMDHVAEIFGKEGADAWWTRPASELVPAGVTCKGCGAGPDRWEKEHNIVDVWFESGVSWLAIAEQSPDHARVDLYLEGSDQHRGWFHSSLLAGVGVAGRAPYRTVLTHGFVLDENGHEFSKNAIERAKAEGKKTSYVPPEDLIKKLGTEMLRMWVGSTDFRSDVTYSQEHVEGLGEWYRKLRNTVRWALGALDGFVSAGEQADREHVSRYGARVDRYMLAKVDDLTARCRAHYEAYEFHAVHRALVDFVTVELSALYADVTKDRLYLDAVDAPGRRAAQVVLYEALRALTTLMAPILCFTAEDVWSHLPRRAGDPDSVHLATYPEGAALAEDDAEQAAFASLLTWRERVTKELEPFRAAKHKSLDARVQVIGTRSDIHTLVDNADELADLFIVSAVAIVDAPGEPRVEVTEHGGHRCERCWKWFEALAAEPNDVCERCAGALTALKGA